MNPTWAVCNLIDMKSITTYHTTNKWKTILWNQMWMIVLYFHYEKYQNIYSKYNVLCSPKKQKQLPIFAKSKSLMQFLECLLKQSATNKYPIHTQLKKISIIPNQNHHHNHYLLLLQPTNQYHQQLLSINYYYNYYYHNNSKKYLYINHQQFKMPTKW